MPGESPNSSGDFPDEPQAGQDTALALSPAREVLLPQTPQRNPGKPQNPNSGCQNPKCPQPLSILIRNCPPGSLQMALWVALGGSQELW